MRTLARVLALSLCCTGLIAQPKAPDVNVILKDVMKFQMAPDQKLMAFWCPMEFLVAAGKMANPALTDQAAESELGFLRNYAIFMVQASHEDAEGRESYLAEAQIKEMASLSDAKGRVFPLVGTPPPKLTVIMAAMSAGVKRQPGSEHMEFIVFDNCDASKRPILQARQPGSFTLSFRAGPNLKAASITWQTPLDSLIENALCAKCSAPLQTSWKFCPLCGQPIQGK